MVTASFNAGPVFSYTTAVLARGLQIFLSAIFCPAAVIDVDTRASVTFRFFFSSSEFEAPSFWVTAASRTFPVPRLIGACLSSFFIVQSYADFDFLASVIGRASTAPPLSVARATDRFFSFDLSAKLFISSFYVHHFIRLLPCHMLS